MIAIVKEFTRHRAPRLFALARASKDQLMREYRVIRRVRIGTILYGFFARAQPWQNILPLQVPLKYKLESDEARRFLEQALARPTTGTLSAHTVYLDPTSWRSSALAPLAALYSADAGIKIMKNSGGISRAPYMHGRKHSRIQARLSYSLDLLGIVANVLSRYNLGPRLYDLIEIDDGQTTRVAYVVQHVVGNELNREECAHGVARLQQLAKLGVVAPINEDGFAHPDFSCPSCNGNARSAVDGTFRYVDFQNFVLPHYAAYLRRTALEASASTHFGDRSFVRGGQYLYQSVPGVSLPAKRDVAKRAELLDHLLAQSGVSIAGKLVLDFGCNIGMMSAHYLARGATWVHGWDHSAVTEHTERLLLALGCTRFSLTGGELTHTRDFKADLPRPVVPLLTGSVISYLAVRRHFGWLPALVTAPWELMLYEGHEGEGATVTRQFLQELNELVPIRVLALTEVRDGDSDARQLALVQRVTGQVTWER